jgi:hypothetical protein
VAKLEHWQIRTKDGIDGLLILEPRPDCYLATPTMRTWRDLPDNPPADEQFTEALRRYRGLTGRVEVVPDQAQVEASRQFQGQRDQFTARRRGAGYGPGDTDADVVGIWVARQRRRS